MARPINHPAVVSNLSDAPPNPDSPTEDFATLAQGLAAHEIILPTEQVAQLDRYRALLWEWNEKLNLTRHTTMGKFVGRDIVDSLQLSAQIAPGGRVLDVGSGGGVPGIVLAICRPDLRVSLCESTKKKARVLHAMVEQLQLPTVVHGCRAEELLELQTFHSLVARAVAPLEKLLFWLAPHWDAFDELLLIKGSSWPSERSAARHRGLLKPLELRKLATYESPAGESVVLRIWRPAEHEGEDDLS